MNRIATGIGLVSGMGLSAFWYKRYPHNDRAIKLARAAIEMAEPHLQCTPRELREKERLFGKKIEGCMLNSKLTESGCELNVTERVWSCVIPTERLEYFRVITRVGAEFEKVKEVNISA